MKTTLILTLLFSLHLSGFSQNWLPLGTGTNNGLNGGITLQSFNGKLIAGGAFGQAGNVNAKGVAMWDDSSWSIVDSSMNNFFAVRPLVIYRGELYGFDNYPLSSSSTMMRLDSSFKWHVVPNCDLRRRSGPAYIYSACVFHDELYVAGDLDSINGVPFSHIAKWDGTNWTTVGTGLDDPFVTGLTVYGNELYAGGDFDHAGGLAVNKIARWNGIAWRDVGGGLLGTNGALFRCFEVFQNELYIGGDFDSVAGQHIDRLAKWNGNTLSAVGGGGLPETGFLAALGVHGNRLIISGYFGSGMFAHHSGTWDGVMFDSLGTGINSAPTEFEVHDGRLYAGGRFIVSANGVANGVAVLDTAGFTVPILDEEPSALAVVVYPNPFASAVTVSFKEVQQNTKVTLTDMLGQVLSTYSVSGNELVIDRAGLRSGVYLLQIVDQKSRKKIGKVMVQ